MLPRFGINVIGFLLVGCGLDLPTPTGPEIVQGDAVATRSLTYIPLADFAARPNTLTVAVYDIPDKTGANLRTENYAEFSKAVTQGASALVVEALSEVGQGTWFRVVERENIEPLLQERRMAMSQIEDLRQRENRIGGLADASATATQIDVEIETFRAQLLLDYQSASDVQLAQMPPIAQALADLERYAQNQHAGIPQAAAYDRFAQPPPLPEMLIADYIVTGAIVAHDSDVISGGTGLRFQNIGVLQQVHKHVITVSLRLVRVSDGEIVANKTASQTVLSKNSRGTS